MNYFFKTFLCCTLLISFAQIKAFASDFTEQRSTNEHKHGTIQRVYQLSTKVNHKKYYMRYYILEDGFTLYSVSQKKESSWKIGDDLVVQDPFEDEDDVEVFVTVKNLNRGEKKSLMRVGWACPHKHTIVDTSSETIDGEKIVTITLDDATAWRFAYFDESPQAKYWKPKEKVVIFIDTHESYPQNPFNHKQYLREFDYDIINLDSKHPLAGGYVKPAF